MAYTIHLHPVRINLPLKRIDHPAPPHPSRHDQPQAPLPHLYSNTFAAGSSSHRARPHAGGAQRAGRNATWIVKQDFGTME